MTKLFVSADIEGVSGIVDFKETDNGDFQSAYFRAQMTREVRAACDAAVAAGVSDILLKDAHGNGRSIDPSALPRSVCILRSWTKDPLVMMGGLDSSFEGVFFIGYHSMAGSGGNPLSHTLDPNVQELRINGQAVSEFVINAYTAASMGVPVMLLTGDRELCESAREYNPNIRTVPVSEGIGNGSVSIHPDLAVQRIQEAAAAALAADPGTMSFPLPNSFEVSIVFKQHYRAYRASYYPGAALATPSEVVFHSRKWEDVLTYFLFVL
ncbi:MAG TPA: M55 family metallopeptidase [Magnetospirillaceae bacterium]|nr:M55 family metallopeptidase [Magnetospirillaceae bacterium]